MTIYLLTAAAFLAVFSNVMWYYHAIGLRSRLADLQRLRRSDQGRGLAKPDPTEQLGGRPGRFWS